MWLNHKCVFNYKKCIFKTTTRGDKTNPISYCTSHWPHHPHSDIPGSRYKYTHSVILTCIHRFNTHSHTHIHTHIHSPVHTHSHNHSHTNSHAFFTYIHIHTYTHIHTLIHIFMHSHFHTHTWKTLWPHRATYHFLFPFCIPLFIFVPLSTIPSYISFYLNISVPLGLVNKSTPLLSLEWSLSQSWPYL